VIYVTVGTLFLDFPRLVGKVDEIAKETGARVLVQTGLGTTMPSHCEHFDFKPRDEVLDLQREARVVVCHAGIGSILDALEVRRPLIVVLRLKQLREHLTDHQLEVAEAVEKRGWGRVIHDIEDLPDACAHPPAVPAQYRPAKHRLVGAVRDTIERVAALKD
jgi:UDP-N-acetylglucosamine transferase subunit ALG13